MRIYPLKKRNNEAGFTMMEIMVVIGIIAILVTFAIPMFAQWVPNASLKSAVQDIYSNLQLAKMEAVKMNTDRSIVFNAAAGTYTTPDNTGITLLDYGASVVYGIGNATTGVDGEDYDNFITYATPDDTASFNSRGMGNNSGYVYLTNSRNTAYAVGSLTSGVIVLKKWNGSNWE